MIRHLLADTPLNDLTAPLHEAADAMDAGKFLDAAVKLNHYLDSAFVQHTFARTQPTNLAARMGPACDLIELLGKIADAHKPPLFVPAGGDE